MDIGAVRDALKRVASLFNAAGATKQAEAVGALSSVLGEAKDQSVDEFVLVTADAFALPMKTAEELARRLQEAGTDERQFKVIISALRSRAMDKQKLTQVAAVYTGMPVKSVKTPAKALAAIQEKFREQVYLASSQRLNAGVTPW